MGWKSALVFLTVSIGTSVYIAWPHEAQPPPLGDGWWGKGDKKDIEVCSYSKVKGERRQERY